MTSVAFWEQVERHSHLWSGQNKFKSYAFIDWQGLMPRTRPYYDLSNSAGPMNVLMIISYWSLRWSWCTEANVPECDLAFWSDLEKAAGAWPYASGACLESIKLLRLKSARYEVLEKDEVIPKILLRFYNFVLRRETKCIHEPKS